jgi:hypothetical protein
MGYTTLQDKCNCYNAAPMSQCLQEIKIKGLLSGANYIFEIWDKFNSLEVLLDTAVLGECTLDLSNLTPNLLNCNAGEFYLVIYETSDYETPVELTFNSIAYDCFILTFIQSNSQATYEYLR